MLGNIIASGIIQYPCLEIAVHYCTVSISSSWLACLPRPSRVSCHENARVPCFPKVQRYPYLGAVLRYKSPGSQRVNKRDDEWVNKNEKKSRLSLTSRNVLYDMRSKTKRNTNYLGCVSSKEQCLNITGRGRGWLNGGLGSFPSHKLIYDRRPGLKMCENVNDGDFGLVETTDPIDVKVRQISPRISAKLIHLYVVSQLCECPML